MKLLWLKIRNFLFPGILLRRLYKDACEQNQILFKRYDDLEADYIGLRMKYEGNEIQKIVDDNNLDLSVLRSELKCH